MKLSFIQLFKSLFLSALVLLSIMAPQLYADYVTPSERVESHLYIRELPESGSNIIGRLLPGESIELVESIAYYYKVIHKGRDGYVSKSWSYVISTPTNTTQDKSNDLIIGSWNIKWFGNSSTDSHNYQRMADIISRFDVAAIQELSGDQYFDRLDKIVAELKTRNLNYSYLVSTETGYRNNPEDGKNNHIERYAFIWDTDRIEVVQPEQGIQYRFVSQPPINNLTFRQVPIYADFKVKNTNGFDFRILTTHTVYNKGLDSVRRAEIQFIHDWMIEQVRNTSNTEKNIISIGNFNANPTSQPHHFNDIISGTNQYRVLLEEPLIAGENAIRTTIVRSQNPTEEYLRTPVYDHVLVSHETSYALPSNNLTWASNALGVVEFDMEDWASVYATPNDLVSAMSNHRPIWFKLDYNAQDLD